MWTICSATCGVLGFTACGADPATITVYAATTVLDLVLQTAAGHGVDRFSYVLGSKMVLDLL
jgi:hypothetical protein